MARVAKYSRDVSHSRDAICAHSFEETARSKHTLDIYKHLFDGVLVKRNFIFAVNMLGFVYGII